MRDALAKTGRKVVYSICEWGVQDPARWARSVWNSWRISNLLLLDLTLPAVLIRFVDRFCVAQKRYWTSAILCEPAAY